MSPMRNSFAGLINLVLFVVLIVIAVFLYNNNDQQKTAQAQSSIWQKAGGVVKKGILFVDNLGATKSESPVNNTQDYWTNLNNKIKAEWEKDDNQVEPETDTDYKDLFSWNKTATGADLVFRTKSGEEHKISLPFKFLSQDKK